jgi:hypothetical protein
LAAKAAGIERCTRSIARGILKIGMDDDGVLSGPPPVTRNAGDRESERCRVKDKAA